MNTEWITICGSIHEGHQVASGRAKDSPYPTGSIAMQRPFFKELGLDLTGYFQGTLNLLIHPYAFSMKKPQYTFRHVQWTDKHPPEDFSFSFCHVEFESSKYAGWVYYPHPETKERHFQDSGIIEIITSFIPNVTYGAMMHVILNSNEVEVFELRG